MAPGNKSIMAGIMAASDRHGCWNSWELTSQTTDRKHWEHTQNSCFCETSKPVPNEILPLARPDSSSSPKRHQLRTKYSEHGGIWFNPWNAPERPVAPTHVCACAPVCPWSMYAHTHIHTCTQTCSSESQIQKKPLLQVSRILIAPVPYSVTVSIYYFSLHLEPERRPPSFKSANPLPLLIIGKDHQPALELLFLEKLQ